MSESIINNKKVIILNKPFLGGWLDKQGNIGHEIIDFFLTDKEEYYVYNNPWGICPNNIDVGKLTNSNNYLCDYLVLTSEERLLKNKDNKSDEIDEKKQTYEIYILYVIKLNQKIHNKHRSDDEKKLSAAQNVVINEIKNRNIKYNDKYLHDIYKKDKSLYLTFEGECIYKAKNPIPISGFDYRFRNKGYLFSDDTKGNYNYNTVLGLINDNLANKNLEIQELTKLDPSTQIINKNKTFLDLIKSNDKEQLYTYMLYSILNYGDLLQQFCKEFKGVNISNNFEVETEKGIEGGRIDISADDNKSQRIIIENKVYSGLNGKDLDKHTTQLSTYFLWGKEAGNIPLCFITFPDYRETEIENEIKNDDPNMENFYTKVPYGKIADFIKKMLKNKKILKDYEYISLIKQIIDAFKNLSYKTKEDLYAGMFLNATK